MCPRKSPSAQPLRHRITDSSRFGLRVTLTIEVPVVIGIDEWALARGHRYGTSVVDLQRRRPIELLAEHDAAMLVPWLWMHSEVKIIARGPSWCLRGRGPHRRAPDARQVADRWPLRDAV